MKIFLNKNSKRIKFIYEDSLIKIRKMAKVLRNFLVVVGVVILILFIIWMLSSFISTETINQITSTNEDGSVTLTATFYDILGEGTLQALIDGKNTKSFVSFELVVKNTGDVLLTNVQPTFSNVNMLDAFDNVDSLSNLGIGSSVLLGSTAQSCGSNSNCDSNEECVVNLCLIALDRYASGSVQNNVDFTIKISGDFIDAFGNIQEVVSPKVTLTYDVRKPICSDGTTINSCVYLRTGISSDKPSYCNFVENSIPTIIDKASICGCEIRETVNGEECLESPYNKNLGFEEWSGSTPISWNVNENVLQVERAPSFSEGSFSLNLNLPVVSNIRPNPTIFSEVSQTFDLTNVHSILFDWKAEAVCDQGAPFPTDELFLYIDEIPVYEKSGFDCSKFFETGNDILINTQSYTGLHTLRFTRQKFCESCSLSTSAPTLLKIDNIRLLP